MINDPHKVLGVSENATQDEIKRAYRKKAKEYHPDLHPDDPKASEKMNEINVAYDMLMNPEKYSAQRAQSYNNNPYGYGTYNNQQSGNYGSYRTYQYGGNGGWTYYEVDLNDFFDFGNNNNASYLHPKEKPNDSYEIRRAIAAINSNNFQEALRILSYVEGVKRNARWFYLNSLANNGIRNTVQAIDNIKRAIQMEPENPIYKNVLQYYTKSAQSYERNAQGYNMNTLFGVEKLCFGLCLGRMCCGPFCCC